MIGGDLAYPNPSNETYETRFFRPYEAALPPPPHVHSGRLVVNKPDLPLPAAVSPQCRGSLNACPDHTDLAGTKHSGDTHCRHNPVSSRNSQFVMLEVSMPAHMRSPAAETVALRTCALVPGQCGGCRKLRDFLRSVTSPLQLVCMT